MDSNKRVNEEVFNNEKDSVMLQILKVFGVYFDSFAMAVFLFSTFTPEGTIQRKDIPVDSIISILGIGIGTTITLIVGYHVMQKAFKKAQSNYSNIKLYKKNRETIGNSWQSCQSVYGT